MPACEHSGPAKHAPGSDRDLRAARRSRCRGYRRRRQGAGPDHGDLRGCGPAAAHRPRPLPRRRHDARGGGCLLPLRRREAGSQCPQPRRAALLRRPARPRRLRGDAHPSSPVPGLLSHPAGAAGPQPWGLAGDRDQRPADPAAVRGRGDRQRPEPGAAAPAAIPVPDARPQPHRRRHRQRHLAHRRPRACAAGAVHGRARRLQPAAALPLHGHTPGILPALCAADQLSALRRAFL